MRWTGRAHDGAVGPAQALATFQAQLSGTLAENGAHVDAWLRTAVDARVVRAVITIYPPGAHP